MTLFLSLFFQLFLIQPSSTDYKIEVWQNGLRLEANRKNTYELYQEEFQLRFVADIGYAFQLNANTNNYYHKTEFKLDDWDGKTVSESSFNDARDLYVDKNTNHFFTYRPDETWNKFDSLIIDERTQSFTGIRTIKTFKIRGQATYDFNKVEVQEMSNYIYITCIITDNKSITGEMRLKGIKHEEVDRLKLILKWK